VLVIGLDPTAWVPGAYVPFIRYGGRDVTAPVVDEREIRGNLISSIREIETLLRSHNRTPVRERGRTWQMRRSPRYPERSLRELVQNAIVHRNYETSFAPARILWFDDRIEITNPGGPFGAVGPTNFRDHNDYRNPDLAAAAKTLGFVNHLGRGIRLVEAELDANGNPPPEFAVESVYWSVTVRELP
jgi:ATP-dependent DNA helicase RecG